jgi:hypothetical protein
VSKHQQQADSETHEDLFLNFLVNQFDEEVPLSLGYNTETDSENISEEPVGAGADGTSVSMLCE